MAVHWPERMLSYILTDGRVTLLNAFLEETHYRSSRSDVCLNGARLKRRFEGLRREDDL
jgi:hypothetical protein